MLARARVSPTYHRNSREGPSWHATSCARRAAGGSRRSASRRERIVRGRPQRRLDPGPDRGGRIRSRRGPGPAGGRSPAARPLAGPDRLGPGPGRRPRRLARIGGGHRRRPHAGRRADDVAAVPVGGQGGGDQADFESVMELITSTVAPTTWDEVGGPGSMSKFPTGVYVDARGVLKPLLNEEAAASWPPCARASGPRRGGDDARRSSPLRMVSLTRLEKQIQLLQAAGRQPSEEMQVLAGLQRIQYVFVYPESGDLVLAGPRGRLEAGPEDSLVSVDTGRPVVRLDDLVVILRLMMSGRAGRVRLPDHAAAGSPGPACRPSSASRTSTPSGPSSGKALARSAPRPGGPAGHRGLRLGSPHAGRAGDGRGRLSHETGGHGPGRGRAGRAKLPGLDHAGPGRSAAADGRLALVVHAQLRRRQRGRRTAGPSPCAARG